MLKDNHIDRAGGIAQAMAALRKAYLGKYGYPCRPWRSSAAPWPRFPRPWPSRRRRIMLDNMDADAMRQALALVPAGIETEVSGGVDRAGPGRHRGA